jgi:hypothetical protein
MNVNRTTSGSGLVSIKSKRTQINKETTLGRDAKLLFVGSIPITASSFHIRRRDILDNIRNGEEIASEFQKLPC